MDWYYAENGQKKGPISEENLEELARRGTVAAETLVWREGLSDWARYASVKKPPAANAPEEARADTALCAECNSILPKDELIVFEGKTICGRCKPLLVQRMLEGVAPLTGKVWRSNKYLMTPLDVVLPQRCIKCNEAATGPQKKRKLYWHSSWVYLALVANLLIYAIIAVCVRKKALALFSICEMHRKRRRNVLLTSWLMVLGGLAMFLVGAFKAHLWMVPTGGLLFVAGIVYGMIRGRLLYAKKIDKEHALLAGCGPDFLNSFPDWKTSF